MTASASSGRLAASNRKRGRTMTLGFYFDGTSCLGCKTCSIACKDLNDLPVGVQFRRVFDYEAGVFPTARGWHYSMACNHCEKPACVASCPTGAMHQSEDGTILHDDEACIGCQSCVSNCPYGVPQYREDLSIVQKCDACAQRRADGKNPVCVDACSMRALDFGDLDELSQKYGEGLVSELPFLTSASTTNPSILVKPKEASLAQDWSEKRQ